MGAQFPPDRYRAAAALIAQCGAAAGDVALNRALATLKMRGDPTLALELTEVVLRLLEALDR